MSSIISCLQENALRIPDRPAVSDDRRTLSYRELWQRTRNLAFWLHAKGISRGARVLVETHSDVAFAVSAMGIGLAGCVFVPVEKNVAGPVVLRIVEETGASLFLGGKTADGVPCFSLESVLELPGSVEIDAVAWKLPAEDAVADILYTTGTTGDSKGVVLSHKAARASAENSFCADQLDADSVYLIASPLNHVNGLRKLYSCFLGGAHAVLLDGFLDVKKYYETIEKYHVNALQLPPSAVRFLLFVSREKLHSLAGQIKSVHTNSAPMTEADKETLCRCLPGARLIFGYGATEAGSVCCAYDYAERPGMMNCVGKAMPHAKITIVDESGRRIASSKDHPGFIAVSGDAVMEGYLNSPVRTAEVLRGNTVYTHDVGYIDEEGFIFVIGRQGDIINCGGLKIAPSEVENTAMRDPQIRDCACFGVPDSITGSAVKLILVPADEASFDMKAFRSFLQSRLERYKIPRFIEVVKAIPKTPNGKTNRKALR